MGSAWTVDFRETNNHTDQFLKPTGSALLLIPKMHFTYKWGSTSKGNKQAFQGYIYSLLPRVFLTTEKYLTTHQVPKLLCFIRINNKCLHNKKMYPEASSDLLQQTIVLSVSKVNSHNSTYNPGPHTRCIQAQKRTLILNET